jgi:hypothetical protein
VEPVDEYRVTVTSGTGGGSFQEGDVVSLEAYTYADSVFNMWTSSPAVDFTPSATSETASFTMPAADVVVRAWYNPVTVSQKYNAIISDGFEEPYTKQYAAGDTVDISSDPEFEAIFLKWVSLKLDMKTSGNVIFGDARESETYFVMPANDIFVGVVYNVGSMVRYTWEAAEQDKIQSIAASYDDVKSWYEGTYMSEDYIEEDASAIPTHDGSHDIPDNIYSSTLGDEEYKGQYLGIEEGEYTAVCTVDDPQYDKIYDIVANYDINVVGDKMFFEIAFDVGTYLAGEDDKGWYDEPVDNYYVKPTLEKIPGKKKLAKKFVKNDVTYYVLSRARK